jgi:hypothetical protein
VWNEALKQSEEQGQAAAQPVLKARGILDLKDVIALKRTSLIFCWDSWPAPV